MRPILTSDSVVDMAVMSLGSAVYALHTARDTDVAIQDYFVHKKVEITQVTTFIHAKLEDAAKEKRKK